jgi:hypothetical protein
LNQPWPPPNFNSGRDNLREARSARLVGLKMEAKCVRTHRSSEGRLVR